MAWLGLYWLLVIPAAYGLAWLSGHKKWGAFYAVFAATIPFYGIIPVLIFSLDYRFRQAKYHPISDSRELFKIPPTSLAVEISESAIKERMRGDLIIQPYIDIIRGGNDRLKRGLIARLIRNPNPLGVKLLKEALRDAAFEIRTFASSALQIIERKFMLDINRYKEKLRTDPKQLRWNLQLVNVYLDYAGSGLPDLEMAQLYRKLGEKILEKISENSLQSHDLKLLYFRNHVALAEQMGDYETAALWWQKILEEDAHSPTALSAQANYYFQKRDYEKLRPLCIRIVSIHEADLALRSAAKLWLNDSEAAA